MKQTIRKITCIFIALCLLAPIIGHANSWGQINQEITRPEGWQQIVKDSPFQLGTSQDITLADGRTYSEIAFGSYPSMDGSTVSVPMAMEFARQHLGMNEADVKEFVTFSTTHNAYINLIDQKPNGTPQIVTTGAILSDAQPVDVFIGTEPSDEELAYAAEQGVTLHKEPICFDAFVFITHKDNPVENLTVEQIQKIYTGEYTNWEQVGGLDAEIRPYQREMNSGSQTAMENLVMKGKPMALTGATFYFANEMSSLVSKIGGYQNTPDAIGYTYKYYIDTLYKDDSIKVLSVDGVYPSAENLRNSTYPFTTSYYGVIRADDASTIAADFLAWMVSEEGQRCIAQAGYIPYMPLD